MKYSFFNRRSIGDPIFQCNLSLPSENRYDTDDVGSGEEAINLQNRLKRCSDDGRSARLVAKFIANNIRQLF